MVRHQMAEDLAEAVAETFDSSGALKAVDQGYVQLWLSIVYLYWNLLMFFD